MQSRVIRKEAPVKDSFTPAFLYSVDAGWHHWHSSVTHSGLMWETSEERVDAATRVAHSVCFQSDMHTCHPALDVWLMSNQVAIP